MRRRESCFSWTVPQRENGIAEKPTGSNDSTIERSFNTEEAGCVEISITSVYVFLVSKIIYQTLSYWYF